MEADLVSTRSLSMFLDNHVGGGAFGVALVLIDINKALGFEAISIDSESEASALDHGTSRWCVITAMADVETLCDVAIIADPCAKSHGRLWRCKVDNLRNSLLSIGGDKNVVLIRAGF